MTRMFQIDQYWINLSMVVHWEIFPPVPWEKEPPYNMPRLGIRLIGTDYVEITEPNAKSGGFVNIQDLVDKLTQAMNTLP